MFAAWPPLVGDRYDAFCTPAGCFPAGPRDDMDNGWPVLWAPPVLPDPRVPSIVADALCGPLGCAPPGALLASPARYAPPPLLDKCSC